MPLPVLSMISAPESPLCPGFARKIRNGILGSRVPLPLLTSVTLVEMTPVGLYTFTSVHCATNFWQESWVGFLGQCVLEIWTSAASMPSGARSSSVPWPLVIGTELPMGIAVPTTCLAVTMAGLFFSVGRREFAQQVEVPSDGWTEGACNFHTAARAMTGKLWPSTVTHCNSPFAGPCSDGF